MTLSWNANPESNIGGYRIYYGEANTTAQKLDVGKVTSRSFTTLTAGKSYFFYVTAYNTAGLESSPSSTVNYTMPGGTSGLPAAPSNLAGVAQSSTSVRLTWRDNSTNETGFRLLRKTGPSGSYTTLNIGANTTTYTDSGLSPSTQYYYKVRANNAAGVSADSTEISVTTPASTTNPNPTPTNLVASASFIQTDTVTRGNWNGMYGEKGALAPYSDFVSPTNCQVTAYNNYSFTWANPTTDARALQKRMTTSRFATRWEYTTNSTMTFNLQFSNSETQRVSFYFLDFNNAGRQQKVEFFDYDKGTYLAGTTITNFQSGVYSTWNLRGRVSMRLTKLSTAGVVLSGIFFDEMKTGNEPVQMAGADTATAGTWEGVYGEDGFRIANETPSLPTYGTLSLSGASAWTWSTSTSDTRALQRPYTWGRAATTWLSTTAFTANVGFNDTDYHRVSLYFVDFDNGNRRQRVEILNASTGAVLDSTELSDFRNGVWLRYDIKGNVKIRVTRLAGANALLSGVFFDESPLVF
ncbi:MAG TPA: fibronectin type III domain-containing protein [Candidatus Kapabacteria bacterium]|nr:fibronectin type III domain-containing protein [Candidatus Kapabacteria bacterium]